MVQHIKSQVNIVNLEWWYLSLLILHLFQTSKKLLPTLCHLSRAQRFQESPESTLPTVGQSDVGCVHCLTLPTAGQSGVGPSLVTEQSSHVTPRAGTRGPCEPRVLPAPQGPPRPSGTSQPLRDTDFVLLFTRPALPQVSTASCSPFSRTQVCTASTH